MIIKLKREFTKKCSNRNNHSLLIILKFLLLFLFFYIKPISASDECITEKNLKIGILGNDYIDYRYYLYYELDSYAQENSVDFEISIVDKNIDDFDIIFGDYNQLKNLSITEISLPDKIKKFYEDNGLNIKNNILPLDLDTFIIVSNQSYSLKNLAELSNIYSPTKYTFGMNFNNNEELLKLILLSTHQDTLKLESHTLEATIRLFNKIYNNSNKNILEANYDELYDSYLNKENLFTLFSDGLILYKNIENFYFNLFPQNNFIWNENLGVFGVTSIPVPYSYYGFSAYINNTNQIGLICHFTNQEVRENTFKNFNIQISPISMSELKNFEDLPLGYERIVNLKNKNIIQLDQNLIDNIDLIRDIIYGNKNYIDLIGNNIYLNN